MWTSSHNWHHEMSLSLVVRLCGYAAPFSSVVVGVSPYPTIRRISQDGKVGQYPLLPYTSMVITSTLSFAYGLLKENVVIWSTSAIATVLGIYYLLCFVQYAHTVDSRTTLPGTVQQHVSAVVISMMFTIFWTLCPLGYTQPDWLIGKLSLLFKVLMFASPLTAIRVVIRTRSARSIPLPFAFASAVNCVLWTIFGLYQVRDPNVYLPNVLGLGFAVAQLILKVRYRVETQVDSISEETLLLTDVDEEQ